jgi:hypothetical protein
VALASGSTSVVKIGATQQKGPSSSTPEILFPGHGRFGYRPGSFDSAESTAAELRKTSHPCRHPCSAALLPPALWRQPVRRKIPYNSSKYQQPLPAGSISYTPSAVRLSARYDGECSFSKELIRPFSSEIITQQAKHPGRLHDGVRAWFCELSDNGARDYLPEDLSSWISGGGQAQEKLGKL